MRQYWIFIWVCLISLGSWAQPNTQKKVTFFGAARAQFYSDAYKPAVADTVTAAKLNSGNVLADLGMRVQANKQMEILAMVRVRNDYGGFWGSGVSFDVRQLYVRGLVANRVRYHLGDFNYKMSPYTLWNNDQELMPFAPSGLQQQWGVLNYDHFYNNDHSWRQQGAAGDVTFLFANVLESLSLKTMTSRIRSTDFGNTPDRLFSGITADIMVNKHWSADVLYTNTYDLKGTSNNATLLRIPVVTSSLLYRNDIGASHVELKAEKGWSHLYHDQPGELKDKRGQFVHAVANWARPDQGWSMQWAWNRVDAGFRSPGAQTKRVLYGGVPTAFERTGNDQVLRSINGMDLMRESSLYNMQLQTQLMDYRMEYDNITPYGAATPNRQGMDFHLNWKRKNSPLTVDLKYYQGQETRGEGTLVARKFQRQTVRLTYETPHEKSQEKFFVVANVQYRNDQTRRTLPDVLPQVNWNNQVLSTALDLHWNNRWITNIGWQSLAYTGSEVQTVRDFNGEIVNFKPYVQDGSEQMLSAGMTYQFSEQSYLSAQWNSFHLQDENNASTDYRWKQWTLLYVMNF